MASFGTAARAPFGRPAGFAHHDLLVGKVALDVVVEFFAGLQRTANVHILPIGKKMRQR